MLQWPLLPQMSAIVFPLSCSSVSAIFMRYTAA
jgi:hypothetical protein